MSESFCVIKRLEVRKQFDIDNLYQICGEKPANYIIFGESELLRN